MELKTNAKCQLIVDGLPTGKVGFQKVEVILNDERNDCYDMIVNRTDERWIYDMPADGLYIYYEIDWPEEEEMPNDFIKHIVSNPTQLAEWERMKIFSICKLRNCALSLEKKSIEEFINSYGNICGKPSDQYVRDLLLISVFVLENLICRERYSEANMILNGLSNCGNLCEDMSSIKKCNC